MPRVPPVTTATRAMSYPFAVSLEKAVRPGFPGVSTKNDVAVR
jgi:hypothetical protein